MAPVAKNAIYTTLKTNKDDRAIPEPRFWYPLFKEQEWDIQGTGMGHECWNYHPW